MNLARASSSYSIMPGVVERIASISASPESRVALRMSSISRGLFTSRIWSRMDERSCTANCGKRSRMRFKKCASRVGRPSHGSFAMSEPPRVARSRLIAAPSAGLNGVYKAGTRPRDAKRARCSLRISMLYTASTPVSSRVSSSSSADRSLPSLLSRPGFR